MVLIATTSSCDVSLRVSENRDLRSQLIRYKPRVFNLS